MFLNSREEFNNYLSKNKRPFMATFYKGTRQKLNILMRKDGTQKVENGVLMKIIERNFQKIQKFQNFRISLKLNIQKI